MWRSQAEYPAPSISIAACSSGGRSSSGHREAVVVGCAETRRGFDDLQRHVLAKQHRSRCRAEVRQRDERAARVADGTGAGSADMSPASAPSPASRCTTHRWESRSKKTHSPRSVRSIMAAASSGRSVPTMNGGSGSACGATRSEPLRRRIVERPIHGELDRNVPVSCAAGPRMAAPVVRVNAQRKDRRAHRSQHNQVALPVQRLHNAEP